MITTSLLNQLGYSINEIRENNVAVVQLYLHGIRFKKNFANNHQAWKFAEQDLSERLRIIHQGQQAGPDYEGEAKKLGFIATAHSDKPKFGWRHPDLEIRSERHDYDTYEQVWKSAYLWAKRFPECFK